MERIKLALEKARQGAEGGGSSKPGTGLTRAPKTAPLPNSDPPEGQNGPLVIAYSQTATVALNNEHLDAHHVVAQRKLHPASHAFDVLRTQVLHKMSENGWRTLAITSPSAQSGKTLVAINLAISISQLTDRTALLIDFDLRRPGVAATLGLHRSLSLNDVLQNGCGLPEALVHPDIDRLTVLPTNEPVANPSEVLASGRMAESNCATHRINFRRIKAQILNHCQRLRSERFIQFYPIHLILFQASGTQGGGNGFLRSYAHDFGWYAAYCKRNEARQWRKIELLEDFFADKNQCARTIGSLRAVTSGD